MTSRIGMWGIGLGLGLVSAVIACDPLYLSEPAMVEKGVLHEDPIVASETWRAADNPHKVVGRVTVSGPQNPVLTLEPGVEVLFAEGASLQIGSSQGPGSLQAVGTPSRPIELLAQVRFRKLGYWGGVSFRGGGGSSRLEHLTVRDCGGGDHYLAACIQIIGGGSGGPPVLRNVKVIDSGSHGIVAAFGGALGAGSENLTVRNVIDPVIRIEANEAGTVPPGGTFSSNRGEVIQVPGEGVTETQTWSKTAVPYWITDDVQIGGASSPVLRIEAGARVLVQNDVVIAVGPEGRPGGLIAEGVPDDSVVFGNLNPRSGSWRGIVFRRAALPESRLVHTVVRDGGQTTPWGRANVTFMRDLGPIVQNSALRNSGGCGITRLLVDDEVWETDFTDPALGNTFTGNADGAQCTHP